jgi:hypothetical protein
MSSVLLKLRKLSFSHQGYFRLVSQSKNYQPVSRPSRPLWVHLNLVTLEDCTMKFSLSTGLAAMVLTATATLAGSGFAQALPRTSSPQTVPLSTGDPQLDQRPTAPVSLPTVPVITASGALGSNHFIRVGVYGMTLKDLMIALPAQMDRFEQVKVMDQSGKDLPAKILIDKTRVTIAFDQPVAPGNSVQVLFTGIQMQTSGGDILLYGLTGERVGLRGEIPLGTARVQVPSRG